jgi:8-oxo-dGTP diphosphatase
VVSVTYYALAPAGTLAGDPAADVVLVPLDASGVVRDDAGAPLELAFDHAAILKLATARLQGKLWYTPVALELAGDEFTLHELQQVYEAVLGRSLTKPAFRRRILAAGLVEPTGTKRGGSHRPAAVYRPATSAAGA